MHNQSKLMQKCWLISTVPSIVKNERKTFAQNEVWKQMKFLRKRICIRFKTRKIVSDWSNQPKSSNTNGRTNLVFISCKFCFAVTKIYFDFPSSHIQMQYFIIRKCGIWTDKNTECFLFSKRLFRIRKKNDSVFKSVQIALIALNIVTSPFHGHEVKVLLALGFR